MGHSGRARFIIVDDHPRFREVARRCLEARGYDVVAEASSAAGALRAVKRHDADAILLDVELGDDDGVAVCEALRRVRPDVAVILASAEDHEQRRQQIESCGARGFIPKAQLARVDLARLLQPA